MMICTFRKTAKPLRITLIMITLFIIIIIMGLCRYPFTITAKWERKRATTFKDRVLTAEEMKTKWLFLLHPHYQSQVLPLSAIRITTGSPRQDPGRKTKATVGPELSDPGNLGPALRFKSPLLPEQLES